MDPGNSCVSRNAGDRGILDAKRDCGYNPTENVVARYECLDRWNLNLRLYSDCLADRYLVVSYGKIAKKKIEKKKGKRKENEMK